MYGLLKENGPFLAEAENPPFGSPYLRQNKHSWHKAANMLYVDNPVGTGFSHSATDPLPSSSHVAKELAEFLLQFLQLYPHYVNGTGLPSVYLFGESYGGTYVVDLAYYILSHEKYKVT